MKIVVATGNREKVKEIREIMSDIVAEIRTIKEEGIVSDPEENGTTFEENALIKARAVAGKTNAIVIADDSGLEVDYMNKEPGIHSARWLGHETSYDIKNAEILKRLEGVPEEKRTARYVAAVAAVLPDGREFVVRETMEGYIGQGPEGENGFGFDPIFYLKEYGVSAAYITPEQKNAISHRGKALRAIRRVLKENMK